MTPYDVYIALVAVAELGHLKFECSSVTGSPQAANSLDPAVASVRPPHRAASVVFAGILDRGRCLSSSFFLSIKFSAQLQPA
jgi:hypothetical protein